MFLQNLKILNISQKNNFVFPKYITTSIIDLEYYLTNKIDKNEKELSFDKIENYEELILPVYFSYFMKETTFIEILYFNEYIKRTYSNNTVIINLLEQFDNDKNIPKEILVKYWIYIYSRQNKFYLDLNKQLRNKKGDYYIPFIKLCYEMLRKGCLKPIVDKKLYRGATIMEDEYKNIIEFLSKNKDKEFPKLIVFTRCFLSFSKNKIVADGFLKKNQIQNNGGNDQKILPVFYKSDKMNDNYIDLNCISNTSISEYSKYPIEEEVLFFPFSCFEITKIKEKENECGKYKKIYLKYLGAYGKDIIKQLGDKFLNKISKSDFAGELIDFGLIDYKSTLTWEIIEENKIEIKNICFYLEENEDFVGFSDNLIKIISMGTLKEKQIIKVHDDKIIEIIELEKSKICSSSLDCKLNIIKLINENKEYENIQMIQLDGSYAKKVIYLSNLDFIFLKNNNMVDFYTPINGEYIFDKTFKEERKIIGIEEMINQQIVYFTNDNHIIFLDKMDNKKEINLKPKVNENLDMIYFENYLFVTGDYEIYIIDSLSPNKEILSFYLIFKLQKLIKISFDKILISLYNEDKNESLIREFKIYTKNNKLNFDCIGEGFCEKTKIYDLIKINSSKIITKVNENSFSTWIKKDEIDNIYNPKYFVKEINNEIKNQNNEILNDENQNKKENEIKKGNNENIINLLNDENQNKEENEIKKGNNENILINYQEKDINEINKYIDNLKEKNRKKCEDLKNALKDKNQNEIEDIKKSIKDIDNQRVLLLKIRKQKEILEIKKSLTFKKESDWIYNILPNAYNKDIKSNLDEKKGEDEKLSLKSAKNKNKIYD